MADTANLIRATQNYPQVLSAEQLANVETEIYQCPANKSVTISTASLCNTSGSTQTVYLSVVMAGDSAGAANRVAIIDLEAGESCMVEEIMGLLLGPADKISGYATAATSVALVISGAVSS